MHYLEYNIPSYSAHFGIHQFYSLDVHKLAEKEIPSFELHSQFQYSLTKSPHGV